MAAPIIRIDNITKRYGALTVLDGLSMEWRSVALGRDPGCAVCAGR